MTDRQPPEDNLADELRNLGLTLAGILRNAWESPERKMVQQEIETGLTALGQTLKEEAESFRASPAGQQLKADVDDFKARVRSGEVESKVREDLIAALRVANAELNKVTRQWQTREDAWEAHPSEGTPPTPREE